MAIIYSRHIYWRMCSFASQGEWTAALPSLLVGVLFGYLMKKVAYGYLKN